MTHPIDLDKAMATGAAAMWTPVVRRFVEALQPVLDAGTRVLEIGYGNGLLACYIADRFGCHITGYDIDAKSYQQASGNVGRHGLDRQIDLRLVSPDETLRLKGSYDAVVIKTVIYNASNLEEYGRWLDWVASVLAPKGLFLNFESGRGNRSVYLYRRLRRRPYTDLCLFDGHIERLYRERFEIAMLEYHGGYSWVLSRSQMLYPVVSFLEDLISPRTADNSFMAALLCRQR